ncbi:hypothetical protein [Streptomyces sp. CA-132043]|uniref:hypothetical protein n=1 Tax=Streptomyces sp. CA-132043 TaxID=3240048 RepID=UPI003D93C5D7
MADRTSPSAPQMLELDDIQAALLRKRPVPCVGSYLLLRIDGPSDGRQLLARLLPHVASAARWWDPPGGAWLSVALSHSGLRALGVGQESLDSFPTAFREGMAARADRLGDTGESGPEHWDTPLGSPDVHLVVASFAADRDALESLLEAVREALRGLPAVQLVHRLDVAQLPTGRTHLGFVDNISKPNVEGSGRPGATGRALMTPRTTAIRPAPAPRSRPASSFSAVRTSSGTSPRSRCRTRCAATAPTSPSANCT